MEFTLYVDFNFVLISIISSCWGIPQASVLFLCIHFSTLSFYRYLQDNCLGQRALFFFFFSFKYNHLKKSIIWALTIGSYVNLNTMLCLIAQLCGLFATPWTIPCQVPLSMEFSRPEYWNEQPFPSPDDLPTPGIEPRSPALQADYLPSENEGTPNLNSNSN